MRLGFKSPRAGDDGGGAGGTWKDSAGYQQYSRARSGKSGRRVGKQARINKLLSAHVSDHIERFQNVTPMTTLGGAYKLSYIENTAEGAGYTYLPFYLFDLTCVKNTYDDDGNVYNPCPFTRLVANDSIKYHWETTNGVVSDNSSNYKGWLDERSSYPTQAVVRPSWTANSKQFIEWADIRLMLYGSRQYPSWVWVEIWQFTDEQYCPTAKAIDMNSVTNLETVITEPPATGEEFNQYQQFWGGQVDSLLASPLASRDLKEYSTSRMVRKKFSKKFMFQPTSTTESDVAGHQVEFSLRHQINKICNYVENPVDHSDTLRVNMDNPNCWNHYNRDMYSPFCNGKGREYLVIRGFAPTALGSTGSDANNAVSFDLMVRRKRSLMQPSE